MEQFPVEVNSAPYEMLLRVPGIGVKSAQRILAARRTTLLDFDGLKRIGVVSLCSRKSGGLVSSAGSRRCSSTGIYAEKKTRFRLYFL